MSGEIQVMNTEKTAFRTPSRFDVWMVVAGGPWESCRTFGGTIWHLLMAGFSFMLIAGCASTPAFEVSTVTPDQFTVTVETFSVKQDDTLAAVKENTTAIEKIVVKINSLEGAIADTRKTMEASLVVSDPNGKEVIKSEDTSADKTANDSQTATWSVAESAEVPLFVTNAPFPCPPCERLKADYAAGKFAGFDVTFSDDWQPSSYPAIRYKSANSATGWAVVHGYDANTIDQLKRLTGKKEIVVAAESTNSFMLHGDMVSIHNDLHGGGSWTWPGDLAEHLRQSHGVNVGGAAITGSIFPYRSNGEVAYQRNAVRFVSRGKSRSWRSNFVSRSSCPTCPR
jgi:hypothetical protein